MVKVKARTNESVDQMLRRFKKLCEKEGIVKEVKRIMYFEKPSEQKRRRIRKAERNKIVVKKEDKIERRKDKK